MYTYIIVDDKKKRRLFMHQSKMPISKRPVLNFLLITFTIYYSNH